MSKIISKISKSTKIFEELDRKEKAKKRAEKAAAVASAKKKERKIKKREKAERIRIEKEGEAKRAPPKYALPKPPVDEIDYIRFKNLQILGLTLKEDTSDNIKRAYRSLARVYHPDKCSAVDGLERMKAINGAYEKLMAV
jgi:DnaJ-domain-containing protein 1